MPASSRLSRRQFAASAASAAALATISVPSGTGAQQQSAQHTPTGDGATTLTPYLLFDGTCAEAMQFYQSVFGGELKLTKVKDSPAKDQMPAFQQDKVINARLRSNGINISASDWLRPNQTRIRGNSVCLYLGGGTLPELTALFTKLSADAEVTDPLREQFFGAYGALNDRYGIRWMFWTNGQRG